jgi:hypothetical protein
VIITLERSGGFAAIPGLSRPIVLDTDGLPTAVAAELERLADAVLEAADRLPAVSPPPCGAADFRTLRLRVEVGGQAHTWRFTDAVQEARPSALVALVAAVERHSGECE